MKRTTPDSPPFRLQPPAQINLPNTHPPPDQSLHPRPPTSPVRSLPPCPTPSHTSEAKRRADFLVHSVLYGLLWRLPDLGGTTSRRDQRQGPPASWLRAREPLPACEPCAPKQLGWTGLPPSTVYRTYSAIINTQDVCDTGMASLGIHRVMLLWHCYPNTHRTPP